MNDVLLTPIRLNELELLIRNSVRAVLKENLEARNSTPKSDSSDLLNVEQAAKFLSLAVPTVYALVSHNKIPFMKRRGSKRLYFLKEDLIEWAKEGRQKTLSKIEEEANEMIAK